MYNLLVFVTMKNIISKFRALLYVSHFQSYFVQSFASYSSLPPKSIILFNDYFENLFFNNRNILKENRNNYWQVSQICKAYTLCIQRNGNYFSLSHKWLGRISSKFCAPVIHTNVKKDVCRIVPACILRIQSYQHHHMSSSYNAFFWYPFIFLLNAWFLNKLFTPFLYLYLHYNNCNDFIATKYIYTRWNLSSSAFYYYQNTLYKI